MSEKENKPATSGEYVRYHFEATVKGQMDFAPGTFSSEGREYEASKAIRKILSQNQDWTVVLRKLEKESGRFVVFDYE